jgi:hypothetical protein
MTEIPAPDIEQLAESAAIRKRLTPAQLAQLAARLT